MSIFRRFIVCVILISAFLVYVQHRDYATIDLKTQIVDLRAQTVKLQVENTILKSDKEKLILEIENIQRSHKEESKAVIEEYIQQRNRHTPKRVAEEIAKCVLQVSSEKKIAAPLILGIMEVESEFNPYAKSKAGARGLMQVMPEWVGKLPTHIETQYDLHDIGTGINAGVDVFKIHLDENDGDVTKGLYHYVNKDSAYASKVYQAIGRYLAYSKR